MSLDGGAVDAGLYTALNVSAVTTLATGGVHNGVAPENTATPYLRFFSAEAPPDWRAFRTNRIAKFRYLVQAIDEGLSKAAAKALLASADGVLHDATLTVAGGTFLSCGLERRIGDIVDRLPGGVVFQIVGAYYLVEVQHT